MYLNKELEIAQRAAIEAGEVILSIYIQEYKIHYKEDDSPVTDADHQANEVIVNQLMSEFPKYAILSEESQDDLTRIDNDWCWIIDPLDGTKEFIKGNGEFTVNIALAYQQKPILGVIYIPVRKELYYAVKGMGAFYHYDDHTERISVSNKLDNITAACSRSHTTKKLKDILKNHGISNLIYAGSSIKGCMIAKGEAEIYYRFGKTGEWDTAALQCIVEESGGIFRQMDDTEMVYNRKDTINRKGFYILNRIENKLEIRD